MNQTPDAKGMEDRVFRSFWQDGLLDCFSGLGLVAVGIAWVTGNVPLGAVIPALLVPIWPLVRKRVTAPRLGQVRFNAARRGRERRKLGRVGLLLGLTAFAATVFLLLAFVPQDTVAPRSWIAGLPAALLGLLSIVTALLWGLRRFHVYAALLAAGAVAVVTLDTHPGWGFLVPGILVSFVGVMLLTRFLRRNPVLEEA
jgi:hypothetical protein